MTLFWTITLAMLGAALLVLLPPLLRPTSGQADAAPSGNGGPHAGSTGNLAILREQLRQTDADRAEGLLTDAQYRQARDDIGRRVLDEETVQPVGLGLAAQRLPAPSARSASGSLWAIGLGVPALVLLVYGWTGNPHMIEAQRGLARAVDLVAAPQRAAQEAAQGVAQGVAQGSPQGPPPAGSVPVGREQVELMVMRMAQGLQATEPRPEDAPLWEILARSYASLQRFEEASAAFATADRLRPGSAQLLADHADVLSMLQGGSARGEPTRLIERALQLDTNHMKALALAGSAAFEREDAAAALGYWIHARSLAPDGTEFARGLDMSIASARAALPAGSLPEQSGRAGVGLQGATPATTSAGPRLAAPAAAAAPSASATLPATAAKGLAGTVRLAPHLAERVQPGDTVFVLARAIDGPRMPLAVARYRVADLPAAFQLDDRMAMSPEMRLSQFDRVELLVRVSRSGQAQVQSGDLWGQMGPLGSTASGLMLTIDRVQD